MNKYKRCSIHIYNEILLSHKIIQVSPFVITWMGLECIIKNEVQTEKDKDHMIPLYVVYRQTKQNENRFIDAENKWWGSGRMGKLGKGN